MNLYKNWFLCCMAILGKILSLTTFFKNNSLKLCMVFASVELLILILVWNCNYNFCQTCTGPILKVTGEWKCLNVIFFNFQFLGVESIERLLLLLLNFWVSCETFVWRMHWKCTKWPSREKIRLDWPFLIFSCFSDVDLHDQHSTQA